MNGQRFIPDSVEAAADSLAAVFCCRLVALLVIQSKAIFQTIRPGLEDIIQSARFQDLCELPLGFPALGLKHDQGRLKVPPATRRDLSSIVRKMGNSNVQVPDRVSDLVQPTKMLLELLEERFGKEAFELTQGSPGAPFRHAQVMEVDGIQTFRTAG